MARSNRYSGIRTTAIHAGEGPDPGTNASAPPITMSSTYVLDEVAGFSAKDLEEEAPWLYTRWANPTVSQLQDKISALEGAEASLCFGSGMAASAAIFLSLLSEGDHLIVSDVCYAGVAELARDTLPRFGIAVTPVDTSDLEMVANAIRPETKQIHIETPANPIMRLTDIHAVAELAKKAEATLSVDSTFATTMATRPLEHDADIVMHSLTKYMGGHGDALGGSLSGSKVLMDRINTEAVIHHGGTLSPFNAWLISRGMATLPLRMKQHAETALEIARFLDGHSKVQRVLYPGLDSHPQADLAARQMANFSGMLSFTVADGPKLAEIMVEHLGVIHYAVSLGHQRSLICYIGTEAINESSFRLDGKQLEAYRSFAGDGVFRLSVGLEDAADLIADLEAVLDRL
ncbi:MAG: PLP-dependent aspartate aminotransferase family protein [Pseudomonadota bacterium]